VEVSVVIPTLNEERFIGMCLGSLRKQTLPVSEIIVVDAYSTDRTVEIAKRYGARVFLSKVRGMVPQRQIGLRLARFPVVASCDADTFYPPSWLETACSYLVGDVVAVWGPIKALNGDLFAKFICFLKNIGHVVVPVIMNRGQNLVFRKDAFEGFYGPPHTDMWNLFNSKKYGRILYLPDNYVYTDVPDRWRRSTLVLLGLGYVVTKRLVK